jgi:hypothetical protein
MEINLQKRFSLKQLKLVALAVLAAALMVVSTHAQSLTWNNGTGNGHWDTTSQDWFNGSAPTTWNNAAAGDTILSHNSGYGRDGENLCEYFQRPFPGLICWDLSGVIPER